MNTEKIISHISNWMLKYSEENNIKGFVIGISGGIDSAVTSILTAKTKKPLLCLNMPIHQDKKQFERAKKHIEFLQKEYENVIFKKVNLSKLFDEFKDTVSNEKQCNLSLANTRARLRMTTLYYYAQLNNYIVVGTGNKVEDFGIGFYTKYGDGGVDISPIADLLKSEVYLLGKKLNVINDILEAPPTDGLWENNLTDEDQIGATYDELEWAMNNNNSNNLSERQKEVQSIYYRFNKMNKHKMIPIPVCVIPKK